MKLLHLTRAWDNHIFCWFFLGLVRMVVMVVVMYMTEIRVYETVCLDLCCRLKVEMLILLVHFFEIATMTSSLRTMVMILSSLWL